jgi:hypothetical protein
MMSLEGFDTCDRCSGYVLTGTYRHANLSSRCRCDELTAQVEREIRRTIEMQRRIARNRWLIEGAAFVRKCRDEDAAIGQAWETPREAAVSLRSERPHYER